MTSFGDIEPRAVARRRVRELLRDESGDRTGTQDAAIVRPGGSEPRLVACCRVCELAGEKVRR
jgi:hypothetical protein